MIYYKISSIIVYFSEEKIYINFINHEKTYVHDLLTYDPKKMPDRQEHDESLIRLKPEDVIIITYKDYLKIVSSKQRELKLNYLLNDIL